MYFTPKQVQGGFYMSTTEFAKVWNNEVKELAQACIEEPRIVELMKRGDYYQMNKEETEYMNGAKEKYKDVWRMYSISKMIDKVEQALADHQEARAIIACNNVYVVLDSNEYFKHVFNGDENNEEWKKRKALRDGLKKIFEMI